MTLRSLLRMAAGLALALFVAAGWSTPSKAHSGHDGPAATTQQANHVPAAKAADVAAAVEQAAQAGSEDCGGHMGQPGSGKSTCCSDTCHAVISTELAALRAVTVGGAILPALSAPPTLSGPTIHIKRPPRPSAALVG